MWNKERKKEKRRKRKKSGGIQREKKEEEGKGKGGRGSEREISSCPRARERLGFPLELFVIPLFLPRRRLSSRHIPSGILQASTQSLRGGIAVDLSSLQTVPAYVSLYSIYDY